MRTFNTVFAALPGAVLLILSLIMNGVQPPVAFAQQVASDLLTQKLTHLADSASNLRDNNQDQQAIDLLQKAIRQPENQKSILGISHLYYILGLCYRKLDRIEEAAQTITVSHQLAQKAGDKPMQERVGYALCVVYTDLGDYIEAARLGHSLLEQAGPNSDLKLSILTILATIYKNTNNNALYLKYTREFIQLARQSPEVSNKMLAENNQGLLYAQEGKYPQALDAYDRAITYAQQVAKEQGKAEYLTLLYGELATIYRKMARLTEAQKQLEQALFWERQYRVVGRQAILKAEIASIYAEKNRRSLALGTMQQAVALGRQTNRPDLYLITLDTLRHIQERFGLYREALQTNRTYQLIADSLASMDKTKAIATIETRYKVSAKEDSIKALRKEATLQRALGQSREVALDASRQRQALLVSLVVGLGLLLSFIGFLLWKTWRLQKQTEKQREMVEQQALELQTLGREKDKLLAIISHDLRAPARQMKELITREFQASPSPEKWPEIQARIKQQIDRLEQLVDNTLHWSLLQNGQLKLRFVQVFLDEAVAETLDSFESFIAQKRIRIANEVQPRVVRTDENLLGLVLRNLLHNALKFTPNEGQIKLVSRQTETHHELTISDTGPGLSATRHHKGTAAAQQGTGLGLPTSEELMRSCNGELVIRERSPHGTEITLRWPLD